MPKGPGVNSQSGGQTQTPFEVSSQSLNQSATGLNYALNPYAAPGVSQGMGTMADVANPMTLRRTMNQYINPYRSAVIDDALGRLRDRRNEDLNLVRGQAHKASAYGGARQGLVEAQLMEDYGRQEDELASRLLQQGFDTRANLALENLNQRYTAGAGLTEAGLGGVSRVESAARGLTNLAPTAFGIGQGVLGQQQQAGAARRSIVQNLMDRAGGQYDTYSNYPLQTLAAALSGIQGNPLGAARTTTGTSQYNPGLLDFASFGAGIIGGGK